MYHPSYTVDLRLLRKYGPQPPYSIIDYGCGNGILLELLEAKEVEIYTGYEVSVAALKVAKQRYRRKNLRFVKIEPGKVPHFGRAGSTDVIILIGVLQYLTPAEIDRVLSESHRVLKKDGIFLASCVTDHWLYRTLNLYQFFYPNHYINHQRFVKRLKQAQFKVVTDQEKGLIIGPLFSHGLVIFFDALDKLLYRNKGKLGPIGIAARRVAQPLMMWEYQLPVNYGYTLFIVGKK